MEAVDTVIHSLDSARTEIVMPTKTVVISLIAIALVVLVFALANDGDDRAIVTNWSASKSRMLPRFHWKRRALSFSPINSN